MKSFKKSIPDIRLSVGKRYIVSEWAPEDNGRREREWWTAPMVSVCENIQWFQMCKIFNPMLCFRSEYSDATLYLKLWYSFYIRVEYQTLHENNLREEDNLCAALSLSNRYVPPQEIKQENC
jgi:hypothetical protein